MWNGAMERGGVSDVVTMMRDFVSVEWCNGVPAMVSDSVFQLHTLSTQLRSASCLNFFDVLLRKGTRGITQICCKSLFYM